MASTKDKLAGKAKQVEGKLTGDKSRKAQGRDQEDRGRVKERTHELLREDQKNLNRAKATAKGAAKRVKRATRELTD